MELDYRKDLVHRLRKRAEIRRNDLSRKSVKEGKPDRISDLLEEAAEVIEELNQEVMFLKEEVEDLKEMGSGS
jgi:hypothetical protein